MTDEERRLKTATLNLRIDPGIKAQAEQLAERQRRSLTSLVEFLLVEAIDAAREKPKGRKR